MEDENASRCRLYLARRTEIAVKKFDGKRRVSFSDVKQMWRPVVLETLEEHLCRVFGMVEAEEERISNVVIRRLHMLLKRSARAVGFLRVFLPFEENYSMEDAKRWVRFLADGSVSVDELNTGLPSELAEQFKFTEAQVAALADCVNRRPEHRFEDEGMKTLCRDCGKLQTTWCSACEACKSCTEAEKGKDILCFLIES